MKNTSQIALEFMEKGKSESCPIIDMHGHMGPTAYTYLPSASLDKMIRTLKRTGVKKIVCSPHQALFLDVEHGNKSMQLVIEEHPETFLGYWVVNPNQSRSLNNSITDFEKSNGFVGFKFLSDYHTYPLTGDKYQPILEYANDKKLLVLVHTWGASNYNSPQLLAEIAEKYPDAVFLMGHSGYGDWQASVAIAGELPNVYLELTAVYVAHDFSILPAGSGTPSALMSCLHVNGIIEFMVENASSKKIVFGTDLPWYSPHYAAGAILFARIDDEARQDILWRNAEKLLLNITSILGSD